MMLEVVLSESALADLLDINDYYLYEVSDRVASKIIDDLEAADKIVVHAILDGRRDMESLLMQRILRG